MRSGSQRDDEILSETIRVSGTVQGVGFRPTVWRLAREHNLRGSVWNDGEGVLIRAWGSRRDLDGFQTALERQPPPAGEDYRPPTHSVTGNRNAG